MGSIVRVNFRKERLDSKRVLPRLEELCEVCENIDNHLYSLDQIFRTYLAFLSADPLEISSSPSQLALYRQRKEKFTRELRKQENLLQSQYKAFSSSFPEFSSLDVLAFLESFGETEKEGKLLCRYAESREEFQEMLSQKYYLVLADEQTFSSCFKAGQHVPIESSLARLNDSFHYLTQVFGSLQDGITKL
ncbi:hypothetical protein H6501_01590 [Candidatus Woesearchaeota archaeon]|nr:hypothetical protein [Nanoarchaeota archaeon]MCB9370268.1 hypothetical protein [Candidatus Woesearchaeota archaeon]USN44792.1 MAG: hypothetical protein H6500_03035 [Candidatus Woesearchaeota archaeon]